MESNVRADLASAARKVPIFGELSPTQIPRVLNACSSRTFEPHLRAPPSSPTFEPHLRAAPSSPTFEPHLRVRDDGSESGAPFFPTRLTLLANLEESASGQTGLR